MYYKLCKYFNIHEKHFQKSYIKFIQIYFIDIYMSCLNIKMSHVHDLK